MTLVIDIFILTMLVITAITIIRMRSLFAAVMLSGIYSLLSACWMVVLDAVHEIQKALHLSGCRSWVGVQQLPSGLDQKKIETREIVVGWRKFLAHRHNSDDCGNRFLETR